MKIGEIRNIIESAYHTRNWLTGSGIRAEFIKQDVGPTLAKKIAELRALVIAPRFKQDIERRDEEIERCERVIARWIAYREADIKGDHTDKPENKLCMDGGSRHVFAGAFRCTLCNIHHTEAGKTATVKPLVERGFLPQLRLVVDNTRK